MTSVPAATPRYRRILLKLSGEALMGAQGFGIDSEALNKVARQVSRVREYHVEVAVVIGGGNIFRGISAEERGIDRTTADYMGMLATVINAWRCRTRWSGSACRRAFSRRSAWPRSPSRTSGAARCATSRRAGW